MTTEERRAVDPAYPWHDAGVPEPAPGSRAALQGSRAGLITRALANVADLLVVASLVIVGYAAVAATRFLIRPATFHFPIPPPGLLLLVGLGVQAVYFAVTWAVAGRTYGDRLIGLRVCGDHGGRLGWTRSVARAVLCTVFPIGLLWVLVSGENRSVQDLLLRTSVTYD